MGNNCHTQTLPYVFPEVLGEMREENREIESQGQKRRRKREGRFGTQRESANNSV